MPKSKLTTAPHIAGNDSTNAFQKFEDFTRRILAVPKKEIDDCMAKEKLSKARKTRKH